MAPRPRKTNKHLPRRVYFKDGAYYFVEIIKGWDGKYKNKWIWLGKNLAQAMTAYAQLVQNIFNDNSMNSIFDRYIKEVSPTKAESTHKQDIYHLKHLREYFGGMEPPDILATDVYRYMDNRSKVSVAAANKEKALLSRVLQMGIRWGIIENNICLNVERLPEKITRDRYVTDEEFMAVYEVASPFIKCAMMIAYLTGLRLGDLLKIKISDLKPEGIEVTANKTHKKQIIKWSDELKGAIDGARQLKKPVSSFYLFSTRDGHPYSTDGFKSIWQRFINKAFSKRKAIVEKFMFKDLRSKAATDLKESRGLEFAAALLQHSDIKTTKRHYIKKEEIKVVEPVR